MNPRITSWRGQRVWIIGASTGIGAALLAPLFGAGAKVAMSARRAAPLHEAADQAWQQVRGDDRDSQAALATAGHLLLTVDVTQRDDLARAHGQIMAAWGGIDLVLWVAGTYHPMRADQYDHDQALAIINTNLIGVLNGLSVILPSLIAQKRGGIAIVSSVAGYSGLPKALIYGPSKAALINLCESLYLDLHPLGIGVTMINPGFVATPLTAGNEFHMPALISANEAARAIIHGLERGRFEIHFPQRFSRWLKLLRILPYPLYMFLVSRITV